MRLIEVLQNSRVMIEDGGHYSTFDMAEALQMLKVQEGWTPESYVTMWEKLSEGKKGTDRKTTFLAKIKNKVNNEAEYCSWLMNKIGVK